MSAIYKCDNHECQKTVSAVPPPVEWRTLSRWGSPHDKHFCSTSCLLSYAEALKSYEKKNNISMSGNAPD